MDIMIAGTRVRTTALKPIGKGGEADIFDIGGGRVLKLFKPPDHPDYDGDPHEQKGAKTRLAEHQRKLPGFPPGLPARVIIPLELATIASGPGTGSICGYAMQAVTGAELLIRLSQKENDARSNGVSNAEVVRVFTDLHATVCGIHKAGAVIGDFNDLNGLFKKGEVFIIDADSFQFGKFYCKVFTQKFVDPTLCDPKESSPFLAKPHNPDSDWYAFAVMLMQSFLFVGPYGGVYQPKTAKERVSHDARPMRRITVFHPDVRYPKPAIHWNVLPDGMLQLFHELFEKDKRGQFPRSLLDGLEWKTCPKCSCEYARFACPTCEPGAIGRVKEAVTARGTVKATTIYMNRGTIVAAAYHGGKLCFLSYENGAYQREDDTVVFRDRFDQGVRFRISGERTAVAKGPTAVIFDGLNEKERIGIDMNGGVPLIDTNAAHYYYVRGGQLLRDADIASEYIGDVLQGQTLFWAGPTFGFGFYWAGRLRVGFVFDAARRGLNDTVKLPPMRGQLIDTSCCFSNDRAWFLWSSQESGRRTNQCIVVRPNGAVEGHAQAEDGDGTWLGTIHGKCATGNVLVSATDEGLIQVKNENGTIAESKRFPDTEPFVSTDVSLIVGGGGIYVVKAREITLLRIS